MWTTVAFFSIWFYYEKKLLIEILFIFSIWFNYVKEITSIAN